MTEVQRVDNPPVDSLAKPPIKAKTIAYALFIILSIGGVALAGAGAAGYFHVGVLSQLKQVDALIMIAAGGGAALFGAGAVCVIKYCGKGKTSEPAKKTPPKLPHILGLELDESHPLQQPMAEDEVFIDLEDMPLYTYLHPSKEDSEILKGPKLKDLCKALDERINQFDQVINLKQRMEYLKDEELSVLDLSFAWKESPLRINLTLDDEPLTNDVLYKANLSTIYRHCNSFTDEQWKDVKLHHCLHFDLLKVKEEIRQKVFDVFYSDKSKALIGLFTSDRILQLHRYFSEEHWQVMSHKQIQELDFSKIDDGKKDQAIKSIFKGEKRALVNGLLPKQKAIVKKHLQDGAKNDE